MVMLLLWKAMLPMVMEGCSYFLAQLWRQCCFPVCGSGGSVFSGVVCVVATPYVGEGCVERLKMDRE